MSQVNPSSSQPDPFDFDGDSLASMGYRMPAEWEPHDATWLSWPKKEESWPGKFHVVPPIWAEMIRHLAEGEDVHVLVNDAEMRAAVARVLREHRADASNVHLHEVRTNDSWIRDFGPIFVRSDTSREHPLVGVDWVYNSWGEKYGPWDDDDKAPVSIGEILSVPIVQGGMVLEGGSIDVNGAGLLVTTEQCLLNPNRNPRLSREQIEERIRRMLGVTHLYWLGDGIEGDDTDGHVDDLTRFVSENAIVTVVEGDKADTNYNALRENLQRLKEFRTPTGGKFDIIKLPMPDPVVYEEQRLPASYANFYIANACVLVPTYDSGKKDDEALGILKDSFPDRRVVGIRSVDLVWGLGAFHCVTQQQPRV